MLFLKVEVIILLVEMSIIKKLFTTVMEKKLLNTLIGLEQEV